MSRAREATCWSGWGDKKPVLPGHGSEHELPKWIVEAIKKQLGLR